MKFVWNPVYNRQIIISFLVLVCVVSVFLLIVFLSANSDEPSNSLPSPSPANFLEALSQRLNTTKESQVQGVNNYAPAFGPNVPPPTASPSATIKPSPTPTVTPTPTSTPTSTPQPTPTATPTATPTPTPEASPTSTPTPSPSTSPSPTSSP